MINTIGRPRFSAIVSDSTGNTLLGRNKVAEEVPTIIPLANCVHHLSNTIGDIVKQPCFSKTLSILRAVITKIHKSHLGTAEFKAVRNSIPGASRRGLEAIGKTRFGTIIYAAHSLERNLPILKEIVRRGNFDLGEYEQYFDSKTNLTTIEFEFALAQLVHIGTPAIQAMACLESNMATTADVYLFYHAFFSATLETLLDPGMAYATDVQTAILGILEWRHKQLLGSGNLASDVYLLAAYLLPSHITSGLFKIEASPNSDPDYAGICNVPAFKTVANYLLYIAANEIKFGHKPEFTKWQGHASIFTHKLVNELKAYSRQQYLFNSPYDEDLGPLLWWNSLCNNELSQILPFLAIKIFSVRVNSMEEERTGSVFTWLASPLCSQISVNMMGAITHVHRHFKGESKPRSYSMKRPKLHFYDFADRFKENTAQEEKLAGPDSATMQPAEDFSDIIVNKIQLDQPDNEDQWLSHDGDSSLFNSASGVIDASPVAMDSTFITDAFSLDEPTSVLHITHSSLTSLPELFSLGDDNNFSLPFGV